MLNKTEMLATQPQLMSAGKNITRALTLKKVLPESIASLSATKRGEIFIEACKVHKIVINQAEISNMFTVYLNSAKEKSQLINNADGEKLLSKFADSKKFESVEFLETLETCKPKPKLTKTQILEDELRVQRKLLEDQQQVMMNLIATMTKGAK